MASESRTLRPIAAYNGLRSCTITPSKDEEEESFLKIAFYKINELGHRTFSKFSNRNYAAIPANKFDESTLTRFAKEIVLLPEDKTIPLTKSMEQDWKKDKDVSSYFNTVLALYETDLKEKAKNIYISPCDTETSYSNNAITCSINYPKEIRLGTVATTQFEISTPKTVFFATLIGSNYHGNYQNLAKKICSLSETNLQQIKQSISALKENFCESLEHRIDQLLLSDEAKKA